MNHNFEGLDTKDQLLNNKNLWLLLSSKINRAKFYKKLSNHLDDEKMNEYNDEHFNKLL